MRLRVTLVTCARGCRSLDGDEAWLEPLFVL